MFEVPNALSRHFHVGFFLGPQAYKGHFRVKRSFYLLLFFFVHRIRYQTFPIFSDKLHIHPHRAVAQGAHHGLAAMAQVEMDVGPAGNGGLAVNGIDKVRLRRNAILFLQSLAQQQVGRRAGALPQLVTEAQGLPAPLGGEFFQSRRQVKIKDMVVHVNHWFFSCCSINFSISSRYCAASTKS